MGRIPDDLALINAIIASELTVKHLWMRYRGLGGRRTRQELQDYLCGESEWPQGDRGMLADALYRPPPIIEA